MYYNSTVQDFKTEARHSYYKRTNLKLNLMFPLCHNPAAWVSLQKIYRQIILKTWQIITLHIGVVMHFKSCCPHQQSGLYLKPQDLAKA